MVVDGGRHRAPSGLSPWRDRWAAVTLFVLALVLAGTAIGVAATSEPRAGDVRGAGVGVPSGAVFPLLPTAPTVDLGSVPGPPAAPLDRSVPLTPIVPGSATSSAAPDSVEIPAIGVDAPVVSLGLDAAGALAAPSGFSTVGWYAGGPAPGSVGPALLAGHVDSREGSAVFWRLRELRPGDRITVRRVDATAVVFAVTRVEQYPKDAFPTEDVYGLQAAPVLRLVTCGGVFDEEHGHYRDNVVVFARAVG